ncbi:UNVERIFIED_CONTAM: hypothetical protein GTU68_018381 [Idotea baltica]|nr:hypothetical protein [Idotea baltica]
MELRVDLEDFEGEKRWAKYDNFYIEDSAGKYKLTLGEYSGDAGDSLSSHSGVRFSTKENSECAYAYKGGWWYHNCHHSNLNGYQYKGHDSPSGEGINWLHFRGYWHSLKSTSLSVRPLEGK